jgi:hypothetical protein
MRGNRYDRGRMPGRGYGREYGRQAPMSGRERYDQGARGGYDRGWTEEMAYGREPGMQGAPVFTPFGWDPMMRWGGWDPLMGFVPYQDAPREWSYGLAEDARRYEHDYYRGSVAHRYGGDYGRGRGGYGADFGRGGGYGADYGRGRGGYSADFGRGGGYGGEYRTPPRQSPLYGRGGDRAVREWAQRQGYHVESTIQPRLGPRR